MAAIDKDSSLAEEAAAAAQAAEERARQLDPPFPFRVEPLTPGLFGALKQTQKDFDSPATHALK